MKLLREESVLVTRSEIAAYEPLAEPESAPELPSGLIANMAQKSVRKLLRIWGLDGARFGTRDWNPFGDVISPGGRVTIKPNWVLHYNKSGESLDCLITHPSLIEAVAQYVALARPSVITIGDAPIQGCNFARLAQACGIPEMSSAIRGEFNVPCRIVDFRRTTLSDDAIGSVRHEDQRAASDYVLFNLADRSLLENFEWKDGQFRVTMYNPDYMKRTHSRGKHQYLVAREVIEADLVVNLPKLKTHMKAGITGALKNLVGINGNKEYLPHHRKGGAEDGGDCYGGKSWLKVGAEHMYDVANRSRSTPVQLLAARSAEVLVRSSALLGGDSNIEGAWYGNDTVWRMSLDLQRILRYGRSDASFGLEPQRRVMTITDAIISGEGEGPLANTPYRTGFLTGGMNPAAVEWVNCRLMGFDPLKIPIVREAFGDFPMPLTSFPPFDIAVQLDEEISAVSDIFPFERPFEPAGGWRGHCELT
jgi:uncharacterized protein (DUF362 family)